MEIEEALLQIGAPGLELRRDARGPLERVGGAEVFVEEGKDGGGERGDRGQCLDHRGDGGQSIGPFDGLEIERERD